MSGNHQPESGALAELTDRVKVLEIALTAALAQQTKQQRADFLRLLGDRIAAHESLSRSTADPLTWRERLAPHVKRLTDMLRSL